MNQETTKCSFISPYFILLTFSKLYCLLIEEQYCWTYNLFAFKQALGVYSFRLSWYKLMSDVDPII